MSTTRWGPAGAQDETKANTGAQYVSAAPEGPAAGLVLDAMEAGLGATDRACERRPDEHDDEPVARAAIQPNPLLRALCCRLMPSTRMSNQCCFDVADMPLSSAEPCCHAAARAAPLRRTLDGGETLHSGPPCSSACTVLRR